jgi:hypothetical protein
MPEIEKPADDGAGPGKPPEGTPPTPPEAPKPITMTQEEFDRIIADRVRRAKPADYDDLLKLKAEKDAAAEAEKTELEKAKDAQKAAEKAVKDKNSLANAKLVRAELLSEATTQNAADTDIVIALLAGSKDITVDDDGNVLGVKEAVMQLLKDKPVLVKGKGAPSASGGEFGGSDPKTKAAKIADLERIMNDITKTSAERATAGRMARELKFGITPA